MKKTFLFLMLSGCCAEPSESPAPSCVATESESLSVIDETECAWYGSSPGTEGALIEIRYPRTDGACPVACGWDGFCAGYADDLCFPCPAGVEVFVPLQDGGVTIECPEAE